MRSFEFTLFAGTSRDAKKKWSEQTDVERKSSGISYVRSSKQKIIVLLIPSLLKKQGNEFGDDTSC